jgi:hypothetical protein
MLAVESFGRGNYCYSAPSPLEPRKPAEWVARERSERFGRYGAGVAEVRLPDGLLVRLGAAVAPSWITSLLKAERPSCWIC